MDRVRDELSATGGPELPGLSFPYPAPQSEAQLVDIAPGLKWLRLAMPFALDHVNVYLLRAEQGWLVVDTGLDSTRSRDAWEQVFAGPLRGEKVVGVCCTHYHVDHVGLAGYLTDRWRAPLLMSYEGYFTLRGWPMDLKEVPWQHAEFYKKAGYPEELLEKSLVMFDFSEHISPLPPAFIRLENGLPLSVAGADWQILMGEGHAPEHAMLYSAKQGILISGDQLLPRISTNVSVSVVDPEDEPLSRWLASLDWLAELPDEVLVLPGHGLPFRGAKTRITELRGHHQRQFEVVAKACAERRLSAYQLMQIMYPYQLNDFDLQLALGECLAHLRYLLSRGRLQGKLDEQGVVRYQSSASPA
jgi:glyoxylase-like metal-dependent hydrolase (beta-lactamase superfamily II)